MRSVGPGHLAKSGVFLNYNCDQNENLLTVTTEVIAISFGLRLRFVAHQLITKGQ